MARTDRTPKPLVTGLDGGASNEASSELQKCFADWRFRHELAKDVTVDGIEELARAGLRALGGEHDAVKNAFRVAYQRETMQDRRDNAKVG